MNAALAALPLLTTGAAMGTPLVAALAALVGCSGRAAVWLISRRRGRRGGPLDRARGLLAERYARESSR